MDLREAIVAVTLTCGEAIVVAIDVRSCLVTSARVQVVEGSLAPSTPDDHEVPRPDRGVAGARRRSLCRAKGGPCVGDGIVAAAGAGRPSQIGTTPDDHEVTCPDRGVSEAPGRR